MTAKGYVFGSRNWNSFRSAWEAALAAAGVDDFRFHDLRHTIITELYPAGEVPIPGIDTEFLCAKIRARGPKVTFVPLMDDIVPLLLETIGPDEQVVFFGGDDLFQLADRFAAGLKGEGASR